MNVIRSEVMGFCSGVSRAVKAAETALEQNANSQKKIYSLGPLIHNAVVLSELERRGLKILEENQISSLNSECVVLIRAHGVAPKVLEQITATGATVIDATCPRVALSQRRAAEFSAKGCTVFLAGDAGHGEVEAVKGSARENFVLVREKGEVDSQAALAASGYNSLKSNCEAVEGRRSSDALVAEGEQDNNFHLRNRCEAPEQGQSAGESSPVAVLLSQTTFSPEEFSKIAAALKERIPSLEVFDTICPATQKRQEALLELSKKASAIVVVGGKKSANTRRLYEMACTLCPNTFFVENAEELQKAPLIARIDALRGTFGANFTVGVTAGASTPDYVIEEVVLTLQSVPW